MGVLTEGAVALESSPSQSLTPPPSGGTTLYKLCRYVSPQRVWRLSHFGLKAGLDFDHYGLKLGMVFKGNTGPNKRICLFKSK